MPARTATYRLQLNQEFDLDAAAAVVPYLAELGISHAYCSPILQAAPGSTHGYDVVDHGTVNVELGGSPALARFRQALAAASLGEIDDIVPNHMAADPMHNRWWRDVLGQGQTSAFAECFDIDWSSPDEKLTNKIHLPVLGDRYGRTLDRGDIWLARQDGELVIRYLSLALPANLPSLADVLVQAARIGGSPSLYRLGRSLRGPKRGRYDGAAALDLERVHRELLAAFRRYPAAAGAVDDLLAAINGDPEAVHQVLEQQHYRLAFWRTATEEIDYRRFFDVADLVGLRIERPRVFQLSHRLILDWLAKGEIDGVRVDHVDGLREPASYLQRLHSAAPAASITVEKILEPSEELPPWPVAGTTGYDFHATVNGLFVDPEGWEQLVAGFHSFVANDAPFEEVALAAKLEVLDSLFAADLRRLARLLADVCAHHRRYRDFTSAERRAALRAVAAAMPVYRAYLDPGAPVREEDGQLVKGALEAARQVEPELDDDLWDVVGRVLRLDPSLESPAAVELCLRLQQLTPAAMAKGIEDTALYRFHPLLSVNDVGSSPARPVVTLAQFHQWCSTRQQRWPASVSATSTHDSKRSEDVRARLNVLSEMPVLWWRVVGEWARHNDPFRTGELPDAGAEYLLYQTLVGAFPLSLDRAVRYMEKACREARLFTSWTHPSEEYETAMRRFLEAIHRDPEFSAELGAFVERIIPAGRTNSLAQTLIKLTAPGVPDLYQGSELWDLSLVDPDNRRPVDYERRRQLLREVAASDPAGVLARPDEGAPKLHVVSRALHLRRSHPEWFGPEAAYEAMLADGPGADHLVAFARGGRVVSLAPRLIAGGDDSWRTATVALPPGRWSNLLTGEELSGGRHRAGDMLARFPVALLVGR